MTLQAHRMNLKAVAAAAANNSTLPDARSRLLAGAQGTSPAASTSTEGQNGTGNLRGGLVGGKAAGGALNHHSLVRRSSPNSSSQYSSGQHQQWRVKKDLNERCSWRFAAIFFILLSSVLVSALIYTTGESRRSKKKGSVSPK